MIVWRDNLTGPPSRFPLGRSRRLWISPAGVAALPESLGGDSPASLPAGEGAVVLPLPGPASGVACIIVPDSLHATFKNGCRLSAGAHVLEHGDRVDLGEQRIWFSGESAGEQTDYDPETDGADLFCARTKRRIRSGETIVRCPGVDCSLIYVAEAWELGLPCHGCGFDPQEGGWKPPVEMERESLEELLKL